MIKHSANTRQLRHDLTLRFEKIRNLLLTDRYAPQLGQPLANWALPADRRLPRALLHRTLGDLLRTPFDSLAAVPGIGHKKMQSLVKLLDRALHTDELQRERLEDIAPHAAKCVFDAAISTLGSLDGAIPTCPTPTADMGDPSNISEVTWATWRATVVAHRLGHEPLGCFANSLHELPRVIWSLPLDHYAGLSLAQIRQLKTHGEKRVRAVVTIFGRLHSQLNGRPADGSTQVRLTPAKIEKLEAWAKLAAEGASLPEAGDIRRELLEPLVEQIAVDAGEQTATMLRGRLGLDGPALSVRKAAMRMRLTRARIYQLLEDAATVVDVRWPRGKSLMRILVDRAATLAADSSEQRLLKVIAETFFPTEFRPAQVVLQPFARRYAPQENWSQNMSPMRPVDRLRPAPLTAGIR